MSVAIKATNTLPIYLNAECLRKALEKASGNRGISLRAHEIKLISADGENYCSDIYRAHVVYDCVVADRTVSLEQSFVIKDLKMDMAALGSTEYLMYDHILQKMEGILSENGIPQQLSPKSFLLDRVDKELYIMEDLSAAGFKMADRFLGVDESHACLLLQRMAQFHAASMIYFEQHPAEAAEFPKSHYAKGVSDALSESIVFGGIRYAIDIVEQWQGFEDIAAKMRTTLVTFNTLIVKLLQDSKIKVLNHGDLWINNALFKYIDGEPKDVVFVDFQSCFLSSPAIDLNYFLYTSVKLDVLKTRRYELLRHYYATLRKTLQICGGNYIPSWQTLVEDMRHKEFYGYYSAVCELPICCMSTDISKGFTAETFTNAEVMPEKRRLMFENQRVLDTLRYTLDRFNELGILD